MGRVTAVRSAEAFEIAGIQALQDCSGPAPGGGIEDTLYPLLAMSVLSETGGLQGQALCDRVIAIADQIPSYDAAAELLNRAAGGFARSTDGQSAADLLEAAAVRRLRSR